MSDSAVSHVLVSFAKKISTVALVYIFGKYDLSIAWLIGPLILSVVRDEWQREKDLKRSIAKACATTSEKEVVLARLGDLPSWVFFPDVERAEWLNKIFKQIWPNINHYVKDLLKDSIEPTVRDSLAAYKIYGFKFEKMILGSIPMRIGGVKVYDGNQSRNEIIMDIDIFYAGDCDISFSLSGTKSGIKDLQVHGMCRVIMKPLIKSIPMVGGLQVFFLNNPEVDFNLVGLADFLDMPGLSDVLRKVIQEKLAAFMVLPNKLNIHLSDEVAAEELKAPEPEGVLRVHVVEAKDLMKKDIGMLGKGKSDPYAILSVGAQQFRTPTIDNTVNPKWDYWCEAEIWARKGRGQIIVADLWDWDPGFPGIQNDDYLGRATVDVNHVIEKGEVDLWVTLEDAKHGLLHLRMTWFTLSSNPEDLNAAIRETQLLRVNSMSTAVLTVFLDGCKNLPQARTQSKPDPYVVLTVNKKTEQTSALLRTSDPVYEQGFTFLVNQPRTDSLFIKVMDQKTGLLIGQVERPLLALLERQNMELRKQPVALAKSGPESKIHMSLQMKILARLPEEEKPEPAPAKTTPPPSEDSLSRQASTRSHVSVTKQPSTVSTGSAGSNIVEEIIAPDVAFTADAAPGLRHRGNSMTSYQVANAFRNNGDHNLGKIQITLRYSKQRQRLIVVVHKISNLPLKDPTNIPDPYVKLYLLPDRKDSKRKTDTVKDNCNPVYDQTIEYVISEGELNTRQLEVSVVTKKGWSAYASVMGQVVITLANLDIAQATTLWYDLMPETPRDA